jgi:hypothetical protein
MKSQIRGFVWFVVLALLVAACGGGDGADDGDGGTTTPDQGTTGGAPDTTAPPTDDTTGGTTSGAAGSGDGSMTYTITGGVEASGEAGLFPGMSFYDNGVWTIAFGDESGTLILINLDPSTPSINITTGTGAIGGTSSECSFQVDRQDEDGAAGSIECSDAATTGAAGLTDGSDISATFDANP